MKQIVFWIGLGVAACNSTSSTSGTSDSGSSDSSAADDGGGGSSGASGGGNGDALAGNDGMASGHGSSGSASSSGSSSGPSDAVAPVPRTDGGKTDEGCVTHADCAPGYFCYLGATSPSTVCGGPSGSCASCQGGTCGTTFECSCLLASLCSTASPCSDNGKVIVCQQQPQGK